MPKTPNFNWDLFVTGQVKVSEPLNRIVSDVDDYLARLINALSRLGEGVADGLIVTLTGNLISVSAGVAVKKGYPPFVLTTPASLQKTADTGYVVIDWSDFSVKFVLSVEASMTPLAFINGNTVTDLRRWAGLGAFNTLAFNLVDLGSQSGSLSIVWSQGNLQKVRLTGATTLSFLAAQAGQLLTLILVQGGGATVSFPSTIKWHNNAAPTLPSTTNRALIVQILFDGTDYYGWTVMRNE